jgi:co-chaperonin GroES (HSP10)
MYADNVLVKVDRQQLLRPDGGVIVLPDTCKAPEANQTLIGTVVAVGPGHYPDVRTKPERRREPTDQSPRVGRSHLIPTTVRPGERVLLDGVHAGESLQLDGCEHRIVREAEILAVVDG